MTMPDSLAAVHEDGACETPSEESQREAWIDRRTQELEQDWKWWDEQLEGVNPITANLPFLLARCARRQQCIVPGMKLRDQQLFYDGMSADISVYMETIARDAARAQAESEYNESGR